MLLCIGMFIGFSIGYGTCALMVMAKDVGESGTCTDGRVNARMPRTRTGK